MAEVGTLPAVSASPHFQTHQAQHHESQYTSDNRDSSDAHSTHHARKPSSTPVRRRISKACDKCNQLRTKCDGLSPCKHCADNNLRCEYVRERKKRGKVSKKDLARMAAQTGYHESDAFDKQNSFSPSHPPPVAQGQATYHSGYSTSQAYARERNPSFNGLDTHSTNTSPSAEAMSDLGRRTSNIDSVTHSEPYRPMDFAFPNLAIPDVHFIHGAEPGVFFGGEYGALPSFANGSALSTGLTPGGMPWDERMFAMNTPSVQSTGLGAVTDDVAMQVDGAQIHRPQRTLSNSAAPPPQPHPPAIQPSDDIRYPVLKPIIPYLKNIIPLPLAFDLLEHYFSTSSTSYPHPRSPYIITFIFGKRAFLRPQRPRSCSMALLASMLWIAARTSDAKYLSASPSSRGRVCQKLLELTVKLLRPLVHRPPQQLNAAAGLSAGDVAGAAMADVEEPVDHEGVERSANGTLDDVATYIHLGVVVSASEYKGASLRWWNAAWGLARELKLGRELAPNSSASVRGLRPDLGDDGQSIAQPVTEEEREERRRIWWLLFSMDRHLSLCYNKPICLPDRECETLLQPMDERSWQNNDFDFVLAPDAAQHQQHQAHGPPVVFNGPSLFGYFLPLMAILGEIIDLNHARSHPRFGSAFINAGLWDEQARIINLRLENFEESVRTYEAQHLSDLGVISANVSSSDPSQATSRTSFSSATTDAQQQQQQQQQQQLAFEAHMQQKKALVYATHIMHVLHILLTGRWDPIALLDDADLWIYSQSFVTATGHAVAAAEACGAILTHDPDISFMPFLYGIYLLQGSFLLLLMADKLGRGAAPDVIRACETVVRAHEACAVTLNTEYQRNFRKVMRSALGQVRGQCGGEADAGVEEARRREVLSLYRWTGDGTGLNTE